MRTLKNKKDVTIRITIPAITAVKVSHDHFFVSQIERRMLKSIISPPTSVHLFLALISHLAMVVNFYINLYTYGGV